MSRGEALLVFEALMPAAISKLCKEHISYSYGSSRENPFCKIPIQHHLHPLTDVSLPSLEGKLARNA